MKLQRTVDNTSILIDFTWTSSLGSPSSKHKNVQKRTSILNWF